MCVGARMTDETKRSEEQAVPAGKSWPGQMVDALGMLLLYYGIQGLTILFRVTPKIFSAQQLRDHPWIALDEHHIWQMLLALALIGFFSKGKFSEWGLNVRNAALSLKILWKFCIVYSLIIVAVTVLPALYSRERPSFNYPVTAFNIIGWLTFEWILVGVSEEILFRGLIHTNLARTWRGVWRIGGVAIPTAGIATTVIFCLAHVSFAPPYVNWWQQAFAFGLGIYYSTVYHRTGSLLNPMLAHSFGDGIVFVALYLLYWFMR